MVIGVPGRVKRELSDDDAQKLRRGAAHYVENYKRFLAGLAAI